MRWSQQLAIHQMVRLVVVNMPSFLYQRQKFKLYKIQFFNWLKKFVGFLKGALVGSHKGSCRLYNTSGTSKALRVCMVGLVKFFVH